MGHHTLCYGKEIAHKMVEERHVMHKMHACAKDYQQYSCYDCFFAGHDCSLSILKLHFTDRSGPPSIYNVYFN